jgi:hypothetical protein
MTDSEKIYGLKRCPFCNAISHNVTAHMPKHAHYVMCSYCNATTAMRDTPEQAAEDWNRRCNAANRELIGLLEKKIRDGMAERFIAIADHIQENADALKKYEWEGNEARCRELCSMYIRELAHTIQMDEMLARIDAALKGGKE